jgi:ketosteroid isomerase-like protein
MRVIPLTLGLLAAATMAGCSKDKAPAPGDKAQTRQDILALQKRFRDAVRAKNAPAVVALMAPDFVQVNEDGTILSRDEVAGELKKTWPAIQSIQSWTMDLDGLTVEGRTAEARVTDRLKAVVKKPQGGTRTVEVRETTRTVWEYTPDGWRYKRITESPDVAVAPQ